jgi:hypothetical protein
MIAIAGCCARAPTGHAALIKEAEAASLSSGDAAERARSARLIRYFQPKTLPRHADRWTTPHSDVIVCRPR